TASVYSLNLFVSGALSPLIGLLIDRYGPRTVMPIGALLLAAGFVGSSQIHQLWHFYLWFGLVGAVGLCAVQVVPHAAMSSYWFGDQHGKPRPGEARFLSGNSVCNFTFRMACCLHLAGGDHYSHRGANYNPVSKAQARR